MGGGSQVTETRSSYEPVFAPSGKFSSGGLHILSLLQVVTASLVALTIGLARAHALEFPAKMRWSREDLIATQTIYGQGFSIGGAAGPVGILGRSRTHGDSDSRSIDAWTHVWQ